MAAASCSQMMPHTIAAWDCHAHVFGPYAQYPLAENRSYTPPEARLTDYLNLLGQMGLTHGVLVHPSAYGDDHSLLLDALVQAPQLRGVTVLQRDHKQSLPRLRRAGVRAARFSHRSGVTANFAGSATLQDLLTLSPQLADAGLHAELWTDCQALSDILPSIHQMPVPVVIDHMGGFDVRAGVNAPSFRALQKLLESGKIWIKLCAYRNIMTEPDWGEDSALEKCREFHMQLLQTNPERLLWGSDWPHLRAHPTPDAAKLLMLFKQWTENISWQELILRHNPNALYQ